MSSAFLGQITTNGSIHLSSGSVQSKQLNVLKDGNNKLDIIVQ
jgi:hypothetical protein